MGETRSIIGLCGFKGSGKDTVGNSLARYGYSKDSFAKPLKDICSTIFGWDRQLLEGDTAESRNWRETTDTWWSNQLNIPEFTPRLAMQLVGTDSLRMGLAQNIWVASLENRLIQNQGHTVIVDCRFPNELDVIRNQGGKIIWVQTDSVPDWYDLAWPIAQAVYEEHVGASTPGQYRVQFSDQISHLKSIGAHESEWMWLAYPVDSVIENTGTILDLDTLIDSWYNAN